MSTPPNQPRTAGQDRGPDPTREAGRETTRPVDGTAPGAPETDRRTSGQESSGQRGSGQQGTVRPGAGESETPARDKSAQRGPSTRRAVSDKPQNMGMFRFAVALYGLAVMAYGIWQILAGTGALPDHGSGVTATVESSYAGMAAVLVGVGASLVAIAVKFQWVNLLGFMCFALFLGGIGHILAWAIEGLPHWSMIVLMVLDLVLPPVLMVWYGWIRKANSIRKEMAAEANAPRTGRTARK